MPCSNEANRQHRTLEPQTNLESSTSSLVTPTHHPTFRIRTILPHAGHYPVRSLHLYLLGLQKSSFDESFTGSDSTSTTSHPIHRKWGPKKGPMIPYVSGNRRNEFTTDSIRPLLYLLNNFELYQHLQCSLRRILRCLRIGRSRFFFSHCPTSVSIPEKQLKSSS